MTDSLKAAAKAGDIKALEGLMNKSFESKGVTVRVTSSGSLLKVVVRGKEAPDKALLPTIQRGLASINPSGFDQVVVTARAIGKADAWSQRWDLPRKTPAESLSIADSSLPASKATVKVLASNETPKSWHQKNWLIISLLVLFPPVGIPLTWMSKWPRSSKICASIFSGIWFLALLVQQPKNTQPTIAQEETQATVPEVVTKVEPQEFEEPSESTAVDPEKFVTASQEGDIATVKAMLAAGISPDTTNKVGNSALSVAASRGNFEVVQAIVAVGPSQATKDVALHESTLGTSEVTTFLLRNGANPRYIYTSKIDGETWPALYTAARFGTPEQVKALLAAGASWDQLSQQQANDALRGASCGGWPFIVKELLAMGADPNNMNEFEDESPLILATSEACRMRDLDTQEVASESRQHDQVVQILKAAGAK
ncbi:ankyrin repeat domain-containing protein [Nodosilinea nodulosa]|uniref:ankyrin repeat domain-containing protein n=1 Tax=Nodosilinea nodulosa TaxID=416001 RepID=UPI0012D7D7D1|nr:ankyrin repeat domain-containing protein [Nodosilinea nodulosa]